MDVKIYTVTDKRTDFIYWQAETFKHFLRDNHEFIVINNGSSLELTQRIKEVSDELGINNIEVENKHHENPNVACAYPIDWMLKKFISVDPDVKLSMIIDFDIFMMRTISLLDFVGNYELVALPQKRGHVNYIWPGVVLINHQAICGLDQVSFHCSGCRGYCPYFAQNLWYGNRIEGQVVDVGGAMYFYFKDNPDCKIKYLHSTHHITRERKNLDALPKEILDEYDDEFAFEMIEQTFFHYGSGSNWKKQSEDYHRQKTILAGKFIQGDLDGTIRIPERKFKWKYRDPAFRYSQYLLSLKYLLRKNLVKFGMMRQKISDI